MTDLCTLFRKSTCNNVAAKKRNNIVVAGTHGIQISVVTIYQEVILSRNRQTHTIRVCHRYR